jgi:hypothetical protein
MVHLPFDVIERIADCLVASTVEESRPVIAAASLICKDFALSMQKYSAMRNITLRTRERCLGLLALMDVNTAIASTINEVTLAPSSTSISDANWTASTDCGELMERLIRLESLVLQGMSLLDARTNELFVKMIIPRQYNITQLIITTGCDTTLGSLDFLIYQLPKLETLRTDSSPRCIAIPQDSAPIYDSQRMTKAHWERPLRRFSLRFGGYPRVQALPQWFADRPYLLSIEELKIDCGWPALSESIWDIVITSSSTLKHLNLVGPTLLRRREALPSIIESGRFKTLIAPALTTLHLSLSRGIDSLNWTRAILSSISHLNSIRKIHFDDIIIFKVELWYNSEYIEICTTIDTILAKAFPELEQVRIQMQTIIDDDELAPSFQEQFRPLMPTCVERDILKFDVSAIISKS